MRYTILGIGCVGLVGCRSNEKGEAPPAFVSSSSSSTGAPSSTSSAPKMTVRTLEELISRDEPGMALVRGWIAEAKNHVEVLDVERAAGERALVALQVTTRSPMGAIALETGGLLIDHGWVRVLGGGHPRLPRAIHDWNRMEAGRAQRLQGAILVGDDAVGGFFALNGGGLGKPLGHVFYLSPTTARWEDIAPSYTEWLTGTMSGNLSEFYEGMRWPGWEREIGKLGGDQGYSVYPFLWAKGPEVGKRSRRAVPIAELWVLHAQEFPKQLGR